MSNTLIPVYTLLFFLLINQNIALQALRYTSNIDRSIAPINLRILPAPYNNLTTLKPPKLNGRLDAVHRAQLINLIHQIKPKNILDISCDASLAAIYIATMTSKDTLIYAINNDQTPESTEQWLSNIIHHKLIDRLIVLDDSTIAELSTGTTQFDLIYLHELESDEQLYAALNFWDTKLSSHGVLCGNNDFLKSDYSRTKFIEYTKNLGYSIQITEMSFWRLIKI